MADGISFRGTMNMFIVCYASVTPVGLFPLYFSLLMIISGFHCFFFLATLKLYGTYGDTTKLGLAASHLSSSPVG
jgi:hypothetical protein